MENKNWFHDFEGCSFPKISKLKHTKHIGETTYNALSLKTKVRFQRDGIWYKRICIETNIDTLTGNFDEDKMFDYMQRFIEKVYEQILFGKIEKDEKEMFFDKPDSLQITEEERLLTEYPYLKQIYERL